MVTENKDLDKLFKSTIEPFKVDPSGNVWNSLDADLARKQTAIYKTKANRLKLFSICLLLLLISFISYHFLVPAKAPDNSRNVADRISPLHVKKSASGLNRNVRKTNNKPLIGVDAYSDSQLDKTSKNLVKKKSEAAKVSLKNNNPLIKNPEKLLSVNETNFTSKKNNGKLMADKKKDNKESDDNVITHNSKKVNLSDLDVTRANQISRDNTTAANKSDKTDLKDKDSLTASSANSFGKELTDPDKYIEPDYAMTDARENHLAKDSIILKENGTKSLLSIAVFYSPDYTRNHLKENMTNSEYVDATSYYSREKPEFSFTTGISIRYDLAKRWSISSGLNYSTIAYSISLPTIYAKYGLNSELHYQYPTSCGIIQLPNSNYPTFQYGDSLNINASCSQLVKLISIPLSVRFQLVKNKFTVYATSGFCANFLVQERAIVRIGNSETTIINNIDGLKAMNYSFLFSAGLQYGFDSGVGLFIEPGFKGSITSLTKNTPVNCYPYSFSLNTGISFHF